MLPNLKEINAQLTVNALTEAVRRLEDELKVLAHSRAIDPHNLAGCVIKAVRFGASWLAIVTDDGHYTYWDYDGYDGALGVHNYQSVDQLYYLQVISKEEMAPLLKAREELHAIKTQDGKIQQLVGLFHTLGIDTVRDIFQTYCKSEIAR